MDGAGLEVEVMAEEGRRDRLGRRSLPAQRREELVGEYLCSGLSQAAFARRAGVRYPTFAHWVQEARRKSARDSGGKAKSATVRFAQVRLNAPQPPCAPAATPPAPHLQVSLPGGIVAAGADAVALAALVRNLLAGGH